MLFAYSPTTGRRIAVTDALSNTTYTAYDPEGRVIATWGAHTPSYTPSTTTAVWLAWALTVART